MSWAKLIERYGEISAAVTYVGKQNGHWIAPPAIPNTLTLPSVGRIDIFKEAVGLDLTQMYPAGGSRNKELTDKWTWDFFLTAAEKCHKAGHPFGVALGQTGDTANWVGAVFTAYGAELVDKDGNITVKSEPVKQVLDWFKKLVPFLPPDVFAWDDSSNNKALISGQAALIFNPPSAWAVAVRDAPKVAEQCWHFPSPKGPEGPLRPGAAVVLGHLEILARTRRRRRAWRCIFGRSARSSSWSPAATAMTSRPSAACATSRPGPRKARPRAASGTTRRAARSIESVSGSPAPANIANQIFSQATMAKMIAQCTQSGKTIDQAIDWAASELEGFKRS